MHESRDDFFILVAQFPDVFVSGVRAPPVRVAGDGCGEDLEAGGGELEALGSWVMTTTITRVGVGVVDACAGAVNVEAGFGEGAGVGGWWVGDDDVWFSVHEAAGFEGFDFEVGEVG